MKDPMEWYSDPEVYFYDDELKIVTIIRGPGYDEWKEVVLSEEEYFKRKLAGK